MELTKQEWLVNYLITHGFLVKNTLELQSRISGMTANQIIEAMEKARNLREELNSSPLGKELL